MHGQQQIKINIPYFFEQFILNRDSPVLENIYISNAINEVHAATSNRMRKIYLFNSMYW